MDIWINVGFLATVILKVINIAALFHFEYIELEMCITFWDRKTYKIATKPPNQRQVYTNFSGFDQYFYKNSMDIRG